MQVVRLHSPSENDRPIEIGRTEIISNSLNPKFVTIVPVVSERRGKERERREGLVEGRSLFAGGQGEAVVEGELRARVFCCVFLLV